MTKDFDINGPERPNYLTPQEAIEIIGQFLPNKWKLLQAQDVEVKRVEKGFCNQVYSVSIKTTNTTNSKNEPDKVVLRKYGGNFVKDRTLLKPLTVTQELVLFCELERRNIAPKLYGFFDGGRIEEFIEMHEMTEEESLSPLYECDLAKNISRFHAVDNLPFPRPGYDFRDSLRDLYSVAKKVFSRFLASEAYKDAHYIFAHDWESELKWLSPFLHPSKHRMVLMHWDIHFHNIGVRHNQQRRDTELSTVIYDYEFSSYNIRGKDLGVFLLSRAGLLNPKIIDKENTIEFPSSTECRSFLVEYMKESKKFFTDDWDETALDSFHHIMMEAIVGAMVSCMCYLFPSQTEPSEHLEPDRMVGWSKIVHGFYFACKKKLQTKYSNFANDVSNVSNIL